MSVTETYEPVLLETDGSETDFDFDFSVFDDTDLVVAIVDPDTREVISTPELGVDYTVTLNTSTVGGTVVFGTAPADEQYVSIRRNIPTTQGTDIPSGGLFRESQIENALDRAVLLIQQLEESVSRALLQSPYSEALDLQFPAPVAGTVLGWNSAEDGLENKTLSGTGVMAIASQAQAEAGTDNDTLMTPLRTAQAIAAAAISTTKLTGIVATANGGTGSSANANSASGVVVLDADSKLPAVDGSLLTNLPAQGVGQIKGWVKFSADGTIAGGANVSSVGLNSTGNWTVNWTSSLGVDTYSVFVQYSSNVSGSDRRRDMNIQTQSATSVVISCRDDNNNEVQVDQVYVLAVM